MKKTASIILTVLSVFILAAQPSYSTPEARRILSLVDYIGGDYKNAVSGGEIINNDEYNEMLEFSSEVRELFGKMESEGGDKAVLAPDLEELGRLIDEKAPPQDVESLSASIKNKIISAYGIIPYPPGPPSLEKGKALFAANCSQCHGAGGGGDGPIAQGLDPAPANFLDPGAASVLSPFKVYNTTVYGIAGTGMPSFPQLSDEEKWDVAFYVLSLGPEVRDGSLDEAIASGLPDDLKDYKSLATQTNSELEAKISGYTDSPEQTASLLAYLRKGGHGGAPSEVSPITLTSTLLNESVGLYRDGRADEAYDKALDAYLEGFERVEPELFVTDRDLAAGIETRFGELRGAMKSGKPAAEVEAIGESIQSGLTAAEKALGSGQQLDTYLSFVNSFAIIVREGLEAILIIAAIIAFMGASGAGRQIRYIHYGWILALAAGLLTWFLASTLISISGARRELIEGVTSLIAAAVLFYVSYWLISKIDVRVWKRYIKGNVERALSRGSLIALASVSFFAVYREAFETVLFYQALWFQAGNSRPAVIWGAVAGAIVLLVLFFVIFKLALKIPLKYFFSFTSVFLYLLSFILLGKGIKELQEAGVVGVTQAGSLPVIDVLGFYPTLETVVPQAVLLGAFLFAVFWIHYVKREKEKQELAVSVSRIAEDMKDMHAAFDHIKTHITEWTKCEDIDLEAEDLDMRIHDVISHVEELEGKLGDFYSALSNDTRTPGSK